MFSPSNMPQTASNFFSAYASLAAFMMLIRSMTNDLIPHEFRSYLYKAFHYFFAPLNTNLTLVFDERCDMTNNEVYEAAEIYLRTKISPKTERLKVSKTPRQKNFAVAIEKGEEVTDVFRDINLKWRFVCIEPEKDSGGGEQRSFELTFNKKFKEKIFDCYLPHVIAKAKEIKREERVIKLYNTNWGSVDLEHPSTFETLAMDAGLKQIIVEDLDRFLRRREFYKKVGKAWKRGYLLYGPPGTGKSSLIAAMANYLKFDVYDLELTGIYDNSDLRRVLLSTTNRSILVIEDIDCSVQMHDRDNRSEYEGSHTKLTLSGLLNFIDGLWSSCGDERIIVFTTNHKDRLDPALLRPGRMDVHINMSYCTPDGFKILASNYLGDCSKWHPLFGEIEGLIETAGVTPAEVAEELMKGDNADVVLEGLLSFLKRKKIEQNEVKDDLQEAKRKPDDDENKVGRKNRRRRGKNGRRKPRERYRYELEEE